MTDPDLVAKRLAFIETRLRELATLARLDRVHGYQDVDLDIVVDAAAHRVADLTAFVMAVRRKLTASG